MINLTLYEYSSQSDVVTSSSSSSSGSSSTSSLRHVARRPAAKSTSCGAGTRRYAVVKERSNPVDASICAEHHLRSDGHVTTSHVFTSVSYVIELRVVATRKSRDTTDDQSTAFLIHYQGLHAIYMASISLLWKNMQTYMVMLIKSHLIIDLGFPILARKLDDKGSPRFLAINSKLAT